jgi:hypothetical protein
MALKSPEFQTLVSIVPNSIQGRSGVDEFATILEHLVERANARTGQNKELESPMWAVENRRLLHMTESARPFPVSIAALSPSDSTIMLSMREIATLIPQAGEAQRRIINRSPNHASVVLWVEAGSLRALLGADLEETGRAGEGWSAVVATQQEPSQAMVFKVPHHGSANSDFPDVWTKMLVKNPIAVVTPFNAGTSHLPNNSDLARIGSRTSSLYCTAAGPGKPPIRSPSVDRAIRRQVLARQPGHVRIRWSATVPEASPRIELFNGARRVVAV